MSIMDKLTTPVLHFTINPGEEFNLEDFLTSQLNKVIRVTEDGVFQEDMEEPEEDREDDGKEGLRGNVGPRFRSIILQENVPTGDGRFIESGAVVLGEEGRGDNIPLMFRPQTLEGHDEAVFVGNFTQIFRDGNDIVGEGFFDDPDENADAAEAIRLVSGNKLNGISADLASMEFEFDFDEEGFITQLRVTKTELGGATIVTIPAFKNARIDIVEELTASADIPMVREVWPSNIDELLSDPELTELTAMTYDPETGRIYGHAFGWKTCHTSRADTCILAPKSKTDYKHYLIGEHAGHRVGVITMDTGHAPSNYDGRAAVEHYDDTGAIAAYVSMGEDRFGSWFSGYLEPSLSDAQIRRLLACGVSGDWRWDSGVRNLELVGVLAVPTPGFQVPRGYMDRSGKQLSLVAAGMVSDECIACEEQAKAKEELKVRKEEREGTETSDFSRVDEILGRFFGEIRSDNPGDDELQFDAFRETYLRNKLERIIREA